MKNWSLRQLGFLIWVQWIDRRATSSFIVGITIQIAVLSFSLLTHSYLSGEELVEAGVRTSVLLGTTACSLSAMSAFQNEFRYQTIWQTSRQIHIFEELMLVRALAMVAITAPALLLPFVVIVFLKPDMVLVVSAVYLLLLLVLTCLTHLLTSGFSLAYNPGKIVPWVRYFIMIIALGTVQFLSPDWLQNIFPFVWVSRIAVPGMFWYSLTMVLALTALWWVSLHFLMRPAARKVLEKRLLDNVEGR